MHLRSLVYVTSSSFGSPLKFPFFQFRQLSIESYFFHHTGRLGTVAKRLFSRRNGDSIQR